MKYRFYDVWPEPASDIRSEVIRFWLEEQAMPEGVARERSSQLVVVCRDEHGSVAGVCTAVPYFVTSLDLECFYYRAFVGKSHRAKGLMGTGVIQQLLRRAYDSLQLDYQRSPETAPVGLYLEIQNKSIQRNRRELVWTDLGANIVYIGKIDRQSQARVWYFEDAETR